MEPRNKDRKEHVPKGLYGKLEFTKKGKLRTDAEIAGISNKIIKHRQRQKKELFRQRESEKKVRQQEHRSRKEFVVPSRPKKLPSKKGDKLGFKGGLLQKKKSSPFSSSSWTPKKKKEASKAKPKYSKKERAEFRKMNNRKKQLKKERKKKRREERKSAPKEESKDIQTESTEFHLFDSGEDFCGGKELFSQIRRILSGNSNEIDMATMRWLLLVHRFLVSNSVQMDLNIALDFFLQCGYTKIGWLGAGSILYRAINRFRQEYNGNLFTPEGKKLDIQSESWSENLDDATGFVKSFITSSAYKSLSTVILIMASYHFFPKESALKIRRYFSTEIKVERLSVVDSMIMIVECVSSLVRAAEMYASGAPLNEIFLAHNPYQKAMSRARVLLSFEHRLYSGLPVEGFMCIKEFVKEGNSLLEAFEYFSKKSNPLTSEGKETLEMYKRLSESVTSVKSRLECVERMVPMAICVFGDPGVGKAKILELISKIWSDIKGRDYDPSQVYHRVKSSSYWDGYHPLSTPIVHYSEMGSLPVSQVQIKGDEVLMELTSVIDSKPFLCDMSSVNDKGATYFLGELVLVDANNSEMNIKYCTSNPAAYKRRFLYVEPVVKPQYTRDGGHSIDPLKCNDGSDFFDKWYFNVYTVEAINVVKSKRVQFLQASNKHGIEDLTSFLSNHFRNHIQEQSSSMEYVNSAIYQTDYSIPKATAPSDQSNSDDDDTSSISSVEIDKCQTLHDDEKAICVPFESTEEYECTNAGIGTFDASQLTQTMIQDYESKVDSTGRWISTESLFVSSAASFDDFGIAASVFLAQFVTLASSCCFYTVLLWASFLGSFTINRILLQRIKIALFLLALTCVNLGCPYLACLFLFTLYCLETDGVAKRLRINVYSQFKHVAYRKIQEQRDYIYMYCGFSNWKSHYKRITLGFITAGSIVAIITMIKKFLDSKSNSGFASESCFVQESDKNKDILDLEEHFHCGRSYERVKVKGTNTWNVQKITKSVHRSTLDSLHGHIMNNARLARVSSGDGFSRTYVLGVKENFALINMHALEKIFAISDCIEIQVSKNGGMKDDDGYHCTKVYRENVYKVFSDIALVKLNAVRFRNILIHFPEDDALFKNAKGIIGNCPTVGERLDRRIESDNSNGTFVSLDRVVFYPWKNHQKGACGLPLVALRDVGCCIVSIHSAGSRTGTDCYGISVLRGDIEKAISVARKNRVPYQVSESEDLVGGNSPHFKSPFRYENFKNLDYYGSDGVVQMMNQKSKLKKSCFRNLLDEEFFECFGFVKSLHYGKPLMQPTSSNGTYLSPSNVFLNKINTQKRALDPRQIKKTVGIILDHLFSFFDNKELKLSPLDLMTAINGALHDKFIRRVDSTKSAGYGKSGAKSNYLIRYEIEGQTIDEPVDSLKNDIVEAINKYNSGFSICVMYKGQYKDEPRERSKVTKGKTRVFFVSPLVHYLLSRMFLGPFYSLMLEFSEAFSTAIGVDMHTEAGKLRNRIVRENWKVMEGDYGGYDTSMPFEIGEAVNQIVITFLSKYGYNSNSTFMSACILADNMFPYISLFGDVLCSPGMQPSGKGYTAEDNSLRGLFILVYVWNSILEDNSLDYSDWDFFDHNVPLTYGDDMLNSVSLEASGFMNNVTFSHFVEKDLGMKFTTSDKGDVKDEFVEVDDMTFLKRTFKESLNFGRVIAPLDLNSIYKAMEWTLPSGVVNEATQDIQTLSSCLRELMFHEFPVNQFNRFRDTMINAIVVHHDLNLDSVSVQVPTHFSMFEELTSCPQFTPVGGGRQEPDSVTLECGELEQLRLTTGGRFLPWHRAILTKRRTSLYRLVLLKQRYAAINKTISAMEAECKYLEVELDGLAHPCPGFNYRRIKKTFKYGEGGAYKKEVDRYFKLMARKRALQLTLQRMWAVVDRERNIQTESSDVSVMTTGLVEDVQDIEVVQDISGDAEIKVDAGVSSTIRVDDASRYAIQDFMKRPVLITNLTMLEGIDLTYLVDPWSAVFDDPSVRAKIRNYPYVKADLVVKVTASGTPFHYGKVQIAYKALAPSNSLLPWYDNALSTASRFSTLSYLSQSRGCLEFDISENKPVEMRIPFVFPAPMARLFNKSNLILPSSESYDDIAQLGRLYINSIVPANTTAAAYTPVSLFVYAWLEDVTFSSTTGTVMDITTESTDERKVGPMEKYASKAREVSEVLTSVPILQPYASASSMVTKGLANFASIFGFSVPTMNTEPTRVKNEPFRNGAHTIGYDLGKRLVLDPKQELTIDPRVTGTDKDEMSIAYLCSVRSLFDSFFWLPTSVPFGSPIWACPVSPMLSVKSPLGGGSFQYQPTALAFAASPFEYWRGDITYRFVAVCSAYHRGKLAISFEPNVSQSVVIDGELDTNKQSQIYWDLQQTKSIDVCVNWAFPKAWARNYPLNEMPELLDRGNIGPSDEPFSNGYVSVSPVTALQSPDNSQIAILVYVSSDNMRFNQLSDARLPTNMPVTESGNVEDHDVSCMDLNENTASMVDICQEHFGESPVSFRGLGKRFVTVRNEEITGVGPVLRWKQAIYPPPFPSPGIPIGGLQKRNLYSYMRFAYLGMRGGIKRRFSVVGNFRCGELSSAKVALDPVSGANNDFHAFTSQLDTQTSPMFGAVHFVPHTNGGIEFELPVYTNNLFGISFSFDPFPSGNTGIEPVLTRNFSLHVASSDITGDVRGIDDMAFAEDFSFMRFEGAPVFLTP